MGITTVKRGYFRSGSMPFIQQTNRSANQIYVLLIYLA